MSFTRAAVGWCYGQLGMVEEALNHYRIAHERHKHPIISIGLAYAEFNFGNVKESRALVRKVRESGKEIPAGYLEDLQELEELIAASENQGQVEPGAKVS